MEREWTIQLAIHSDVSHSSVCHSRESGNPDQDWSPGQARNDEQTRIMSLCLEPHTHAGYESDLARISTLPAHQRGGFAKASIQ